MGLRTRIKNIIKKYFWTSKEQNRESNETQKNETQKNETQKTRNTEDGESVIQSQNKNSNTIVSKQKNDVTEPIIVADNVGMLHDLNDTQSTKQEKTEEDHTTEVHEKDDKLSRHRRKARLGLLRFVLQNERCVDLASLHTYSEMHYLIGHKSFSDLMEEMVEDGVLRFDWEENTAHLTEKGFLEIEIEIEK